MKLHFYILNYARDLCLINLGSKHVITLSVFLITESIESYKINETTMKKILLKPPQFY